MTRIIVKSIDDMPGEARDGIPLGCVLDTAFPTVIAYGQGGPFSAAGMAILATRMNQYTAYYEDDVDNEPVRLKATDIEAALMWLREYGDGEFTLYVTPASTHLGMFS